MKRTILAAVVGAIILFIWQFLSWGIINFHEKAQQYTPNESAILSALQASLPEEGGYILPGMPKGVSNEEMEKRMKDMDGKPWASIQYHKAYESDMTMNMIRQFLVNLVVVLLFCWLVQRLNIRTLGNIFLAGLAVGLIVFLNSPYTGNIWYKWFDIWAHFADAMVCWGLVGLWVGILFNRRPVA